MTARSLDPRVDALFVEGPDDGAVVNALVAKCLQIDISHKSSQIVRANREGGGVEWVLRQFEQSVGEAPPHARIGAIVDRDLQANDNAELVAQRLRQISERANLDGSIVGGRFGIWMWPDNANRGALEDFVTSIIPPSSALAYAGEVCRVAREQHGAEHRASDHRKAQLKVRSIWRDARAAGGYGHLIRNLELAEPLALRGFLAWFRRLFLAQ